METKKPEVPPSMNGSTYDSQFYSAYADTSFRSAREILAIIKRVVNPGSVVDVGCGVGTWLKVWLEAGVTEVMGIDGSYVKPNELLIPSDRFRPMDLTAPTGLARQFDLVQSLEVAEHLPEQSAEAFVSFLCSLGPMVLFSAAIPFQGGTRHINEQWPDYWAELFARKGYVPVDIVRDEVWSHPEVAYYYAQNTLLFVRKGHAKVVEIFGHVRELPSGSLARVHPRKWEQRNKNPLPLMDLLAMVPRSLHDLTRRAGGKLRRIVHGRRSHLLKDLRVAQ